MSDEHKKMNDWFPFFQKLGLAGGFAAVFLWLFITELVQPANERSQQMVDAFIAHSAEQIRITKDLEKLLTTFTQGVVAQHHEQLELEKQQIDLQENHQQQLQYLNHSIQSAHRTFWGM